MTSQRRQDIRCAHVLSGTESGPVGFASTWILLFVSIIWTSCTSTPAKLAHVDLAQIKTVQNIGAIHFNGSPLKVTTFEDALIGQFQGPIFGALHRSNSAYSLGAKITAEYGLQDPILEMKTHFNASLANVLGLTVISDMPKAFAPEDMVTIRHRFRDGLVFTFQSRHVELMQDSMSSSRYHLLFKGETTLFDFKAGGTLWGSSCKVYKGDASTSPTFNELTANNGRLLKNLLNEAAQDCADQVFADLLASAKDTANQKVP